MPLKYFKKLIITVGCLFSLLSASAFNAIESYQHQKQGTINKGDTLIIKDEKFGSSDFDWSKIHNKTVNDIITFSLFRDSSAIPAKPFKCTIDLKVEYWSSPDQVDAAVNDHVKLEISYDTAKGVSYQANATYRFLNGYKIKLTVNDISSDELGDPLPAAFRLAGQVVVERSYDMDTTAISPKVVLPSSSSSATFSAFALRTLATTSTVTNLASLSWDKILGAEEYDLEWTFIDEKSVNGAMLEAAGSSVSATTLAKLFRNNATRVTIQQEYYDISLINYMQYLLIRLRPVQYTSDGFRQEGNWSYVMDDDGNTVPAVITLTDPRHEPNFNWQYNAVYAEEGKKKEVVSYFDGTLRNRQSVTINNTDQKVLIQENLFDDFGRPMVSIMPYAKNNSVLQYYSGEHKNSSGGNYTWTNVYGDNTDCINTPQPLSTSAGAGQYYSPNNEFLSDNTRPETHFIPDAAGYPFSVSLYAPDNTGRVAVQGGVGAIFQPGPDNTVSKATHFYFAKPVQWELDRMFGNDVGYANHYLKNMTVDGNGQIAVSYINASGKTIATALAGEAPDNVDALPSMPAAKQETFLLLQPRDFSFDESKLVLSATSTYAATEKGDVSLTYNVERLIKMYSENGVEICSNCYYSLKIKVTDDCNNIIYNGNTSVGGETSDCSATGMATGTINTSFPKIGEYFVTFELGLSSGAMANFTKDYLKRNTNLDTKWSFINTALEAQDMSTCFDDCKTCLTSLGTRAAFIAAVVGRLTADGVEENETIDTWADNLYATLYNQCLALRLTCTSDPCSDLESTLKADVSPGGQYALFDALDSAQEKSINVLYNNWRKAFPILASSDDTYKEHAFELEDGTTFSPNDEFCNLAMIVKYWQSDWGDLFVKYHPEYCALKFCEDNSPNAQWDQRLQMINTIADFQTVMPGVTYSKVNISWLVDVDPAFTGMLTNYKTGFINDLTNYSKNVLGITAVGTKDLVGYVDYALYCADNTGTTNTNNSTAANADNWTTCSPVESCRIVDLEWQMYRDKYIELKQKYYDHMRDSSNYCGNICPVGTSISYSTSSDCPLTSNFTIQAGDNTCGSGLQPVTIFYNGTALTSAVTVSLYYPSDYDGYTEVSQVTFAAGQTSASFCVAQEINLNTILVKSLSCRTVATGFTCEAAAVNANFSLDIKKVFPSGDPSNADLQVTMTYSGPDIPDGATVIKAIEIDISNDSPGAYTHQFKFVGTEKTLTWTLTGKGLLTYDLTQYDPVCSNPNPESTCDATYQYKTSRITSISYDASGISTDVNELSAEYTSALTESINENCEAQAENWMSQLDECLQGQSNYDATRTALKAKLIEICKLGGDADHTSGASTTPSDVTTAEGYTSFKDAIKGMLDLTTLSMICNPWLLDAPYPYDVHMQATKKIIERTDAATCTKLSALLTEYNAANSGLTFYNFLVSKYGSAMTISEDELTTLQNGCNNCRYLLANEIELPVFLDASSKGAITPAEFKAGITAMNNEMNGWVDVSHANYDYMYTTYLNHLWGFTLSYEDYQDYADKLAADPSMTTLLCNNPVYQSATVDPYSCTKEMLDDAVATGTVLYNEYIEEVAKQFRKDYVAYCSAVQPTMQMTTNERLYHFTLYYYDQAGNLVRTIPPEGVHLLDASLQTQIAYVRDNNGVVCSFDGPYENTDKDEALSALSNAFNGTDASALEFWLYNASAKGGQLLATTGGQQFLMNVCLDDRYLHLDVYAISATTGQIDISKSTHTVVDMQAVLPLRSWTHLVFQGSSLNQDNLSVYVNGKLCPAAGADSPNGTCGWELSNGVYPENLAYLKQIRYYNRELTTAEIAANAAEACMSLASDYYDALSESLIYRGRFNVPAEGSAGTIDGGTTESQYSAVYPSHGMASSYAFQSLNSISVQNTPDGGVSKSWYDRKGNLVVTQNAQQATFNKFTYTLFDGQNRVVEVGEKSGASLAATDRYISDDNLITFQNRGTNSQITHSYFDVPYLDNGFTYNQNNLRKRVAALTYRENQTDDVEEVTYYSYDQLGNAGTIWQQIKGLEIKQIEYQYDFATSKVNKLRYQYLDNKTDKFWYGYQYDADNRVVKATTGINSFSSDGWDIENPKTDAAYHYYLHGLLAREELGNDPLVQGNDYIYTLQKWPKAANGQYLSPDYDFGQDGKQGTSRSVIGPDVYGYSLDYYKGDYKPIDNTKALPLSWTANSTSEVGSDLYNGNISRSTVALSQFNNTVGYSYRYDQLNRLKGMRQHALSLGANDWSASTAGSAFKEDVTYDGNGNILTYLRNGSGAGGKAVAMDNLTYGYSKDNSGNLVNNKLLQVKDAVSSGEYTEDLKSQNDNNYQYDNIGNLTADVQAGISNIEWTVYGKIKSIIKTDGSAMEYRYDARGNRVYKGYTHNGITEKTWYVRDAIGNVLAVYGNKDGDGNIYWKEQHLYGSNRLGVWEPDMLVSSGNESSIWDLSGNKHFELANHLGNVLATITDNLSVDNKAIVNSAQDYYPFGMMQPDRHYDDNTYRYGFNGKENDIEFGLQDYGMRIYNPSLGKFLSVDPLSPKYPELTPYQFASNRPIEGIDQDGMEVAYYDPQNKFYYMASDAIRHPLPKGIVLPSNGAAAYAGQNGFNTMVAMGGVVLIVVAPEIIMLGGRAYQTIVITVSQPQNQILIAQTGTFVAGLLNPGPEDIDPNSEMDELGRYVRGIVGKLGKNAVGFLRMMQKEGFCFTGNTQVLTKDGFKNIENIEVGDSVYSCSVLKIDSSGNYKNKVELQRVSNIFKHAINKLVQISLDGSDIISTLTHPYFANGLWTKAGELKIGDSLYDANGHIKRIIGVRNIDTSYINVFNFEVESNHNYYVSSEKVLVHNNCAPVWISEQYGKHILWSFKNKLLSKMSWKDVIKWTKDNEAIYKSAVKEEVRTLEMTAISEGLEVPIGKGVKYFIYDAGKVIGASEGKETQYLRVELASDGSVHGHPITDVDYRKYLKKIKN